MSTGDFPSTIKGFRFLRLRELRPVTTCWDFAVTSDFSTESATELLVKLPEDYELFYFDPATQREESWISVRRAGERYFMRTLQRGISRKYRQMSADGVRASFMSSPFVQRLPPEGIESFTIQRIPDHQRDWHLDEHYTA